MRHPYQFETFTIWDFILFKSLEILKVDMGVKSEIKYLLAAILVAFLYQNCGQFEAIGDGVSGLSVGGPADFATVKGILDRNCVTCHSQANAQNRNVGLGNYQAILDSGSVIAGNSIASRLYQVVEDGSMPQGRPALSLGESEAIRSWIDQGAPDGDGNVANEIPVVTMPADATVQLPVNQFAFDAQANDIDGAILRTIWSQISGPAPATFAGERTLSLVVSNLQVGDYTFELIVEDDFGAVVTSRVNLRVNPAPAPPPPPPPPPMPTVLFAETIHPLLMNRCMGCHNDANVANGGVGGFSVETHAQVVTRVVAGNAAMSPLHIRVDNETMPAGGNAPLNQAEKDAIATWINEGALDN